MALLPWLFLETISCIAWKINLSIDWLIDLLINELIDCFFHFVHRLIDWLFSSSIDGLIDWLIVLFSACKDKKLIKPAYWSKQLWQLDPQDDSNNGLKNEDLIVWMRTAAFPNFRKLYRRVDHVNGSLTFADGLPPGNYSINIDYSMFLSINLYIFIYWIFLYFSKKLFLIFLPGFVFCSVEFPVTEFEGRKYVIISSVSWIGGRNPFLGIAYMTVGCVCLLLSAVFFFIHVKWGKK